MPYTLFQPGARSDAIVSPESICLVFRRADVLIRNGSSSDPLPRYRDLVEFENHVVRFNYIGQLANVDTFAIELRDEAPNVETFEFMPLRGSYGILGDEQWLVAGRASQVVEWDRSHQYCGRCGTRTDYLPAELGKRCPNCRLIAFPRVSPAVIVLIERGDDVLLARGAHHAPGTYALIAGFVEAGEALEDAVQREIREEVGFEVDNIRYFGSQPWPFPHSIMVGFTASYASGEIRIEPDEIEDAQWFSPERMPPVPPRLSIARKLVDYYADKHGIELVER